MPRVIITRDRVFQPLGRWPTTGERGRTFEQFAADWDAGRIADRSSHRVERDFMEWEALTMERQEILALIRELAPPVDAPS